MLNRFRFKIKKRFFRYLEAYDITMQQLKDKQTDGAIVIDVRSSQEYKEGHICGAINIPEYKILSDVDNILQNKDVEYILYCSSGVRSKNAYKKLIKLGYKKVYNLYGGLDEY